MNHTPKKNLAIVGIVAAAMAAVLIRAVGVYIGIQSTAAQKNVTENSETNFKFKIKDNNNCNGGFLISTDVDTETLFVVFVNHPHSTRYY